MKRQIENGGSESNKRQKKSIIDIEYFNYLSQDNYNMIFEQTKDYRSLFPLLFVSKTINEFTKQFLNNNYTNEIKSKYYASLFCNYLGETNQINILKWLHSINCLYSPKIFYIVSSNNNDNNLDLLESLLEIFESKDSILKRAPIKKYNFEECCLKKIVYGAAQENNSSFARTLWLRHDQNILKFIEEKYLSTIYDVGFAHTSSGLCPDDGRKATTSWWLCHHDQEKYKKSFSQSIGKGAAKGNQPTLLELGINSGRMGKYFVIPENFFSKEKFNEELLLKASKHGSFEFCKFYIEKILPKNNSSLDDYKELEIKTFNEAFKYGQVKIMKWLLFIRGSVNESDLFGEVDRNYNKVFEKSFLLCQSAIAKGSLRSLKWAFKEDILKRKAQKKNIGDYGPKLFQLAAEEERIDILNFLKSHDLEYDDSTCAGAALCGSLECLQWAIENGHRTSFWVSACAASKGNIKMLEWLYENGHPINFISTVFSILAGKESTTQWLIDRGFSLTTNNLIFVFIIQIYFVTTLEKLFKLIGAKPRQLFGPRPNFLKWLYSVNCLFNPKIFYIVSSDKNNNNLDLLKWLL
jgi:hypothetical protein